MRKADVLNKGLSGYNTRWAKKVAKIIFTEEDFPRLLLATVFFGTKEFNFQLPGANDSSLESENPQQYVPIEEYSANLIEIIEHIKSLKTKGFVGLTNEIHPYVV